MCVHGDSGRGHGSATALAIARRRHTRRAHSPTPRRNMAQPALTGPNMSRTMPSSSSSECLQDGEAAGGRPESRAGALPRGSALPLLARPGLLPSLLPPGPAAPADHHQAHHPSRVVLRMELADAAWGGVGAWVWGMGAWEAGWCAKRASVSALPLVTPIPQHAAQHRRQRGAAQRGAPLVRVDACRLWARDEGVKRAG